MARFVFVLLLAGCLREDTSRLPGDPDGPLPEGASCVLDSDCAAGSVCTRGMGCQPQAQLYTAHVTWTLDGQPPTTAACDALPELTIEFDDSSSQPRVSYAPVACAEGKFTRENLSTSLDIVKLGSRQLGFKTATIDTSTGAAALDL